MTCIIASGWGYINLLVLGIESLNKTVVLAVVPSQDFHLQSLLQDGVASSSAHSPLPAARATPPSSAGRSVPSAPAASGLVACH